MVEGALLLSYVLRVLPVFLCITVYCFIYSPCLDIRLSVLLASLFNAVNLSYCYKIEHFAADISVVRIVTLFRLCMI